MINTKNSLFVVICFTLTFVTSACASENTQLSKIINDSLNNKSVAEHRTQLHKIVKWPDSCNKTFTYPSSGVVFYKINSDSYIFQVSCTYGAYQGMSLFYKVKTPSGTVRHEALKLPKSYSDSKGVTEIWGNVLTNSTAKSFSVLNLYSGFGHCGKLTTYDLTNTMPKIISQRSQEDCEKSLSVKDPEKWPLVKK